MFALDGWPRRGVSLKDRPDAPVRVEKVEPSFANNRQAGVL
jgi:hypothetical protein